MRLLFGRLPPYMRPGPNGEVNLRLPREGSATRKRFLEPSVWTTPASSIYIRRIIFQWETYLAFLEQVVVPAFYRRRHRIYLIQDNASYHKKQETYDWFKANRRYVEVFQLPPYWPELNATERIWNYTRKHVTHNRFFE